MKFRARLVALFIFYGLSGAGLLFAAGTNGDSEKAGEFDVFKDPSASESAGSDQGKKSDDEPMGLQIAFIPEKRFEQDSVFIPGPDFGAIDSWVFSELIRYSKKPRISRSMAVNFDAALYHTTNLKTAVLSSLGDQAALRSVKPDFNQELSFLHFYVYELDFLFSIYPSQKDVLTLTLGVMPVKMGNSFFRNPVSFFERYLEPRQFLQEYSPLSFPGISVNYVRDIYNLDIMFIPYFSYQSWDKNGTAEQLARYFHFTNPANVVAVKNNFQFSSVDLGLYFFWENRPAYKAGRQNHFGFGTESVWRLDGVLNISWQFLVSNGRKHYGVSPYVVALKTYYELVSVRNSEEQYRMESLFSVNFSGLRNYEISICYYYNGFGYSGSEYNSLINALVASKAGYNSSDPAASLHGLFFGQVLAEYNQFALNQHYIFLNLVNLENGEFFTWGFSAFFSLELFSVYPVVFFQLSVNEYMKVYLQASVNAGVRHSVFKESPMAAVVTAGLEWSF